MAWFQDCAQCDALKRLIAKFVCGGALERKKIPTQLKKGCFLSFWGWLPEEMWWSALEKLTQVFQTQNPTRTTKQADIALKMQILAALDG